MKILAEFSRDWADEFQAEGFSILNSKEEYDALKAHLATGPSFYFGTNEGWECEPLDDALSYREITDEEAAVLYKVFPDLEVKTHTYEYQGKTRTFTTGGSFGVFPPMGEDGEE